MRNSLSSAPSVHAMPWDPSHRLGPENFQSQSRGTGETQDGSEIPTSEQSRRICGSQRAIAPVLVPILSSQAGDKPELQKECPLLESQHFKQKIVGRREDSIVKPQDIQRCTKNRT